MDKLGWALLVASIWLVTVSAADTMGEGATDTRSLNSCLEGNCGEGRTFGIAKRRMMFMFLPLMFKMGVILTLLVMLTVLTMKGLTIGVILLIFAFGNLFAKLKSSKGHPSSPLHVHVHGTEHTNHGSSYSSYGGGPWNREGVYENYDPDASWNDFLQRKMSEYRVPYAKGSPTYSSTQR